VCRFCAEKTLPIDYKEYRILASFISERGKIIPSRITGNCARHQRRLTSAIKQARNASLLPFALVRTRSSEHPMEVVLREDVPTLGAMGEVVKVKPGYGRNSLLPRGLAVEASRRNLAVLEHQKRLVADKRERERKAARGIADKVDGIVIEVKVRAGEEDRLYGSVTNLDLERLLAERGYTVDRRRIDLTEP